MAEEGEWHLGIGSTEYLASDPSKMSDEDLSALVVGGEVVFREFQAKRCIVLAEFDRRRSWERDGARSSAAWIAALTGERRAALHRQISLARAVADTPAVCSAAPRLSAEHLRLLVSCRSEVTSAAYERDERALIEAALSLPVEEFSGAVRAWRRLADPHADACAAASQAARVQLSRALNGWWRLSGLLAPDDGEVLHSALEAGVDRRLRAAHGGDPSVAGRTISSWRAEALVDLAAQSMRREPSDRSAPDRYRIGLVVTPATLGTAPPGALCDSTVYRMVVGADTEVLDVGRSTDIWPVGMRRAITARDGGCIFPGCDRPPSWCDVHHCVPWADGGRTAVDNGALLCRARPQLRASAALASCHPVGSR